MTLDINSIKKSRSSDISKILEKFESNQTQSREKDDRLWSLIGDKVGNGSAVIRFLPNVEGDEFSSPWVTTYSYGFQGPTGKWYIENSLRSLGKPDPVGEHNNALWASKDPVKIEDAKKRRQRTNYYSNILVISDPANPENNGKVFIFKYGKAIFEKLMGKLKPTFEDDEPINPFDLWEGVNFKFRMRKKDGYTNYDDSSFSEKCALGDDDYILDVMNKRYNIQEFIDPKNFKSYDELKSKFNAVMANDSFTNKAAIEMEDVPSFPSPVMKEVSAPVPKTAKQVSVDDDDEEEDTLEYFRKLAMED